MLCHYDANPICRHVERIVCATIHDGDKETRDGRVRTAYRAARIASLSPSRTQRALLGLQVSRACRIDPDVVLEGIEAWARPHRRL